MAKTRAPTKNELAMRRLELSHEFRMLIAHIVGLVLAIVSFAVPLYVARLVVSDLAGKQTLISGDLSRVVAELIGGGSALAVIASVLAKNLSQRRELQRLRRRCDSLEAELESRRE